MEFITELVIKCQLIDVSRLIKELETVIYETLRCFYQQLKITNRDVQFYSRGTSRGCNRHDIAFRGAKYKENVFRGMVGQTGLSH